MYYLPGNRERRTCSKSHISREILTCIQQWASYGELQCFESWSKLKNFTPQELEEKGVSWHRECYQNVTHTGMLNRAKARYERQLACPNETRRKTTPNVTIEETPLRLTRSKTSPYDSEMCFFCDGSDSRGDVLFNVRASSSVDFLRAAIEKSGNDKFRVKLGTSLDMSEKHATKIRYHENCWLNNVTNVLRLQVPATTANNDLSTREKAAQTEFIAMTEINLREGKILIMSELQTAYESILKANDAENCVCHRKSLKKLIQDSIPDFECHRPHRVNESERLSIKKTRDAAIQLAEKESTEGTEEMEHVFKAALFFAEGY